MSWLKIAHLSSAAVRGDMTTSQSPVRESLTIAPPTDGLKSHKIALWTAKASPLLRAYFYARIRAREAIVTRKWHKTQVISERT